MGCQKQLTIAGTSAGQSPIVDAVYVPAPVDKIFGTSGPYLLKFNATTGAMESFLRISSPMYGDMRLCYHSGTGMLFVSGHNEINERYFGLPHPSRDIWRVNPLNNIITPLGIGTWMTQFEFNIGDCFGPQWITSLGNYLYFQEQKRDTGFFWATVNASNFADHFVGGTSIGPEMWTEQYAVDNTYFYILDPGFTTIYRDFTFDGTSDTSVNVGEPIVGIVKCTANNLLYCVCGNATMVRVNAGFSAGFDLNLNAVVGPAVSPDPVRIKCLSDGKLYLPCMGADGIIVWDTGTETGTWKSGFVNPVDVVETPTKKWAVQNSINGLKEIT